MKLFKVTMQYEDGKVDERLFDDGIEATEFYEIQKSFQRRYGIVVSVTIEPFKKVLTDEEEGELAGKQLAIATIVLGVIALGLYLLPDLL